MPKKPGLTLERHKEIAAELKDINHRLQALAVEFGNAYPLAGETGAAHQWLTKAYKAVGAARGFAESNMFREHPESATIHVYYGND